MEVQWQQGGRRTLLGNNTDGGSGHVTADQVPVCWVLDSDWPPFCVNIVQHM